MNQFKYPFRWAGRHILAISLAFAPVPLLAQGAPSAGSLFRPAGLLANPARDLRAGAVGDIVTIVVSDQASATSSGGTNTQRNSTGSNEIASLVGVLAAGNPLASLLDFSKAEALQGQGQTSRDLTLTTTVSARVVATTLNGLLMIEGTKEVTVNSERQVVTLYGFIRPVDITPANTIPSDRISDLRISVNGKGVVDDAIKRRFSLYRIFTEFLPF